MAELMAHRERERSPLLTILMPTRNRHDLILAQARSLEGVMGQLGARFEIIIHDNSTQELPKAFEEKLPRTAAYIRCPRVFDTVEENICAALVHCKGDYVWLLADNHGLEYAGAALLLSILEKKQEDIIVFNMRNVRTEYLAADGPYLAERSCRYFYHRDNRTTISEFAQQAGFSCLANTSPVIIRREIADPNILSKYIEISRINALVAWLIDVGKGRQFLFVNRPLISHGLLPPERDGRTQFGAVGIREGGYSMSVATGLWLRVLDELVAREAMSIRQILTAAEMGPESRYHFGSNLAQQILEQFENRPDIVPQQDICIFQRWLRLFFPGYNSLHALIADISEFASINTESIIRVEQNSAHPQSLRRLAKDLRDRITWWRRALAATPWYSHYYVETLRLYDVYDFGTCWIAVHTSFGHFAEALEIVDLPTLAPVFLRAAGYGELCALIDEQPFEIDAFIGMRRAVFPRPNDWTRLSPDRDIVNVHVSTVEAPAVGNPPNTHSQLEAEITRQDREIAAIQGSLSWRFTAPLRYLAALAGLRSRVESSSRPSPELTMGEPLQLHHSDADSYCLMGFSGPEDWGRWTEGPLAVIRMRHETRRAAARLELLPYMVWKSHNRPCVVEVAINGRRAVRRVMEGGRAETFAIRASDMAFPDLELRLRIATPKQADEDPLTEGRRLGVGLAQLRLEWEG